MPYEHKPNSGTLFINNEKTEPTHSDWQGSGKVECPHCNQQTDYWLNEWNVATDRQGNRLSKDKIRKNLRFKPKQQPQPQQQPQYGAEPVPFDDDLPF